MEVLKKISFYKVKKDGIEGSYPSIDNEDYEYLGSSMEEPKTVYYGPPTNFEGLYPSTFNQAEGTILIKDPETIGFIKFDDDDIRDVIRVCFKIKDTILFTFPSRPSNISDYKGNKGNIQYHYAGFTNKDGLVASFVFHYPNEKLRNYINDNYAYLYHEANTYHTDKREMSEDTTPKWESLNTGSNWQYSHMGRFAPGSINNTPISKYIEFVIAYEVSFGATLRTATTMGMFYMMRKRNLVRLDVTYKDNETSPMIAYTVDEINDCVYGNYWVPVNTFKNKQRQLILPNSNELIEVRYSASNLTIVNLNDVFTEEEYESIAYIYLQDCQPINSIKVQFLDMDADNTSIINFSIVDNKSNINTGTYKINLNNLVNARNEVLDTTANKVVLITFKDDNLLELNITGVTTLTDIKKEQIAYIYDQGAILQ